MAKLIDVTNQRFGKLVVVSEAPRIPTGKTVHRAVNVVCDCGNTQVVRLAALRSGNTTSCGCLRKEVVSGLKTKHGECGTRLYNIWCLMKSRVLNPNHINKDCYADRGIDIHPDWLTYENFRDWSLANGYEDHLTIDRIDNDAGYAPNNCRWATWVVQANNRRKRHVQEF